MNDGEGLSPLDFIMLIVGIVGLIGLVMVAAGAGA